jgi:hypothetical protein
MIDLDEIERLQAAAHPGPYRVVGDITGWTIEANDGSYLSSFAEDCAMDYEDARYVAAVLNAIPELIRELWQHREWTTKARQALEATATVLADVGSGGMILCRGATDDPVRRAQDALALAEDALAQLTRMLGKCRPRRSDDSARRR